MITLNLLLSITKNEAMTGFISYNPVFSNFSYAILEDSGYDDSIVSLNKLQWCCIGGTKLITVKQIF